MHFSGIYIPPYKRAQLENAAAAQQQRVDQQQQQHNDEPSMVAMAPPSPPDPPPVVGINQDAKLQREIWEVLRRVLIGVVNKVSVGNMEAVVIEALRENVVRGRGVLVRALMRAQSANPEMSDVFSCFVAIVNKEFPIVGELLVKRLIIQWKRVYRRRDSRAMIGVSRFLAHLVQQRVQHELLLLKILSTYLCVESPSSEDVEAAIGLLQECFRFLECVNPAALSMILEPMRGLLSGGKLGKRTDAIVEKFFNEVRMWQTKKDEVPVIPPELDLVEEAEQVTHNIDLQQSLDAEAHLDQFIFDPNFEETELEYEKRKIEVLGPEEDEQQYNDDGDDAVEGDGNEEEQPQQDQAPPALRPLKHGPQVNAQDEESEGEYVDDYYNPDGDEKRAAASNPPQQLQQDDVALLNLRKELFLVLRNSMRAEEAAHKILGGEMKELVNSHEDVVSRMVIEAMMHERMFNKFYALTADRLCKVNPKYQHLFGQQLRETYERAEDLPRKDILLSGKFFAFLLEKDSISWHALECIRLTEDATTASTRLMVKSLLETLREGMGMSKLCMRLCSTPSLRSSVAGLFPKDSLTNARFAANFLEEIGVGDLGDDLRKWYDAQRKRPREETS